MAFLALFLPIQMADAKGFSSSRSSGGSRSFSRSSSSSKPSSSGFSSSSSKPKPSASIPSTPSKAKTAFQVAESRKALIPPKPKPKTDYVNDFKKNNASKYPTTFATPPASRPTYIPPATNYGGRDRNIEYNPQTRSYGFFDDLGKFMIYDAITDIAMDSFKKDEKVYVQAVQEAKSAETEAKMLQKQEESGMGFGMIVFITLLCIVGVVVFFVMFID